MECGPPPPRLPVAETWEPPCWRQGGQGLAAAFFLLAPGGGSGPGGRASWHFWCNTAIKRNCPLRSHEPSAVAFLGVKSSPRRDTRGPVSQGAWPFWQAHHTGPSMTSSEASVPLGRRGKSQAAVACSCPARSGGALEKVVQNVKCAKAEALARAALPRLGWGSTGARPASARRQRRQSPPARWHCSCPVCVRHRLFGPRRCWGGGSRGRW